MTVGVRFTISGSDTDFYTDEIEGVVDSQEQDLQIQEHQTGRPYLYTDGEVFDTIRIRFREQRKSTRTKIETVMNSDSEMTLYYKYAYAPATSKTVILWQGEQIKQYHYGERAAYVTHDLMFLEA